MSEERESNDLYLAPNEFAYIQDTTNGRIQTLCGPFAASLTKTDRTVSFDSVRKQFVHTNMEGAKQIKAVAPEGWYIQLKNPAKDKSVAHPTEGGKQSMPELEIGRKENIPGPVSFATWPGQMIRVIQGHHLREDEYVLIRIYDEKSARENWNRQQIKTREGSDGDEGSIVTKTDIPPDLMNGKLYVIRGTDVSFYVPTTGIEVVPFTEEDNIRQYIRKAITLERLEYCILLNQDGNKRYMVGPDVVFPHPTEEFVEADGERKFRSFELNPNSGIYIKVIADYKEAGTEYRVGDELFITGKTHPIYFPREEHSIIKYGDNDIHYGTMIPAGEARYVANRNTGEISLVKGPQVYLPDPREEVLVKRILDPKVCKLMYPGNVEALEYNASLIASPTALSDITDEMPAASAGGMINLMSYDAQAILPGERLSSRRQKAKKSIVGDEISRSQKYSAPRTLTLNTKYDGAVTINVFEGFAVMLTRKGEKTERRVIIGPQTAMLEYDEIPHILQLSTGKPKNTDSLYQTVYLKVANNPITDIIEAESRDYCKVSVKLIYRVTFIGDEPGKWFSIENYVKYLCDHMRSMVRNEIKRFTIEEFYVNSTAILRDLVLGTRDETKGREGRLFEDNAMKIQDVEILKVELDPQIQGLLVGAQQDVIKQSLTLSKAERDLLFLQKNESFSRAAIEERLATTEQRLKAERQEMEAQIENKTAEKKAQLGLEELALALVEAGLAQTEAHNNLSLKFEQAKDALAKERTIVETEALKQRALAFNDKFVTALNAAAQDHLIERISESVAPLRIFEVAGGKSIMQSLGNLLEGTPLGTKLNEYGNGRRTINAPPAE
jgi:major vault protein